MTIEIDELRSLLDYNPETGVLTWKTRITATGKRFGHAGKIALNAQKGRGYLHGSIKGRLYSAHRVAWAIHYGEWPNVVDHINGDPSDNRIDNLRSVTQLLNSRNRALSRNSPTSKAGVRFKNGKWQARIGVGQKLKHLGCFGTFEAAVAARESAEKANGFSPRHGAEPAQYLTA